MADRILRWHIADELSATGVKGTDVQGQAFRLDANYHPIDTWLRVKRASRGTNGTGIIIDINDDGVSIYEENPILPYETLEATCKTFSSRELLEGSIITLDIDQVGSLQSGNDLVVELYLDKS